MTVAFHGGFLLGPPLGGLTIEQISWRATFFFLVPIGLAGIILAYVKCKSYIEPSRPVSIPADYKGSVLFVFLGAALTLLLYPKSVDIIGEAGRDMLALGFPVILWAFLAEEKRAAKPMVNISLFRIRMFTCSVISLLVYP